MNIILWGHPAPARAPRRRGCRRTAAWSSCRPATCCAKRSPRGTPVGLKAKAVMDAGELVSDAIVSALIGERLDASASQGAIFDGFPRTAHQAEALELLLAERGRHLDHVIELVVDEDELVDRIVGRFTCAECGAPLSRPSSSRPTVDGVCDVCGSTEFKRRPDDNEQTVRTRMAEYRAKTAPILPYYDAARPGPAGRRHGVGRRGRGADRRDSGRRSLDRAHPSATGEECR